MHLSKISPLFVLIALIGITAQGAVKESTITLKSPSKTVTFTRTQLLKRPDLTTLEIPADISYQKKMSFQAVPLAPLFESIGMQKDSIIQFHCLDGFSAPLSSERLLNRDPKGAIAYLAIEPAKQKWPALKKGKDATAGPFYLVWVNPKASEVGSEEWPYQLSSFEVKASLRETYPLIFPDAKLAEKDPVHRGFLVFQRTCFSCHRLNDEGLSEVGPDLNIPMSITDYLSEKAIRAQIRDPQSVKKWAQAKMKGFAPEVMSDSDIDSLIAYFKHMAGRKVTTAPAK